ncbi:MAG: M23 family metallopeptidase [Candidatus Aminicenantaceae bacterium]
MKRLIKISLLPILILILNTSYFGNTNLSKIESFSGIKLDIICQDYMPGEVMLVKTKKEEQLRNVQISFLGKVFQMAENDNAEELISFVGIDLGLNSGFYDLKISFKNRQDEIEYIQKRIFIEEKQFPVKKLWVEERYVIPPEKEKERIQREHKKLKALYKKYTLEWLGEGKFVVPTEGKIFYNFGQRRILNNKPRSQHSGVDISAPTGTLVRASNSGKVVMADDLYFSGNTVIIDHGLGVFSLYCHLSEILVKKGEPVKKSDIIGKIGATGRVTGPHLHWGFKVSGSRVDPFSLVNLEDL